MGIKAITIGYWNFCQRRNEICGPMPLLGCPALKMNLPSNCTFFPLSKTKPYLSHLIVVAHLYILYLIWTDPK